MHVSRFRCDCRVLGKNLKEYINFSKKWIVGWYTFGLAALVLETKTSQRTRTLRYKRQFKKMSTQRDSLGKKSEKLLGGNHQHISADFSWTRYISDTTEQMLIAKSNPCLNVEAKCWQTNCTGFKRFEAQILNYFWLLRYVLRKKKKYKY